MPAGGGKPHLYRMQSRDRPSEAQLWRVTANGGTPERHPLRFEGQVRQLVIARHGDRVAYVHDYNDLNDGKCASEAARRVK